MECLLSQALYMPHRFYLLGSGAREVEIMAEILSFRIK